MPDNTGTLKKATEGEKVSTKELRALKVKELLVKAEVLSIESKRLGRKIKAANR